MVIHNKYISTLQAYMFLYTQTNTSYRSTFFTGVCILRYVFSIVLSSSFELKSERYGCLFQRKKITAYFCSH